MLLGTILGAGQTVAMEVATYISAYYDFRHIGYDIEQIKQDEQGLDISDLEGKSKHCICYAFSSISYGNDYAFKTPYGSSKLGRKVTRALYYRR